MTLVNLKSELNVRNYTPEDYEMVSQWWKEHNEVGPTEDMLPPESTFILDQDGMAMACVVVYLSNSKSLCHMHALVKNPQYLVYKEDLNFFIDYVFEFIKNLGYTKVVGMTTSDKLIERYKDFGFYASTKVTTLIKELV